MSHDIFISYSRKDAPLAEDLVGKLQNAGLKVWTEKEIRLGDRWDETVRRAIANARVVLVIWSPNATTSDFVRDELQESIHLNKRIVIVPVDSYADELENFRSNAQLEIVDNQNSDQGLITRLLDLVPHH